MCGIAGFAMPPDAGGPTADQLEAMAQGMIASLKRRGPDSDGSWLAPERGVALVHTRLAIIDLSADGHQPMTSSSGRLSITFNGEIYNYRELRAQLEATGMSFRGHSDTEVLLEALDAWGLEKTLPKLNGMFAFALYDHEAGTIALARDPVGKKPLYYTTAGKPLIFASELSAFAAVPQFAPKVNPDAVAALLAYSYVPTPLSIYAGVNKLGAGQYAIFRDGAPAAQPTTYWSMVDVARHGLDNPIAETGEDLIDLLDRETRRVVERRLEADVPLGAFLSGGIDSSLVVAQMCKVASKKPTTICIGFESPKFNEAPHARAVADHLGTDHHQLIATADDARELIPRLSEIYCEPFADASQLPTYLVSQLARQHVTVALSGDGGDEFFCGYNRYFDTNRDWQKLGGTPAAIRNLGAAGLAGLGRIAGGHEKLLRTARRWQCQSLDDFYELRTHRLADVHQLVPSASPDALANDLPHGLGVDGMMLLDACRWLPDDVLTKVDRASMAVGLEVRNPLLDRELIALSWQIPLIEKVPRQQPKYLLRKLLSRYVPDSIIDRPKSGFAVPISDWLRGPLRDWAQAHLAHSAIERYNLLNPDAVDRLWQRHLNGSNSHRQVLWSILMLQSWLGNQAGSTD